MTAEPTKSSLAYHSINHRISRSSPHNASPGRHKPGKSGIYARRASHHVYFRNKGEMARSASQLFLHAVLRTKQHMERTYWKSQLNGRLLIKSLFTNFESLVVNCSGFERGDRTRYFTSGFRGFLCMGC